MKLSIIYTENLSRPYLLKREYGEWEQHAHFHTKEAAETCRRLIDAKKYPYSEEHKVAMERILTEKEFAQLKKKDRYYNVNKGMKR